MRPRTPNILWLPFVFSIGTISWALLLAGLALLAAVVITPAYKDVLDAKVPRNDYQATLDTLDNKIALQKQFLAALAAKDTALYERLAARQLFLLRSDRQILRGPDGKPLDPQDPNKDHSVESLLAESVPPVSPAAIEPIPAPFNKILLPGMRTSLVVVACTAMAFSFFLGVKYQRN